MTIGGFFPALLAGACLSFFAPERYPALQWAGKASLLVLIFGGIAGAVWCIVMLLTKRGLWFGCPNCGTSSRLTRATKNRMEVFCPGCGPYRVRQRLFRTAAVEKLTLDDEP